ncbi:GGDEF domain-containing protein [Hansschlegelia zhihuaiae]|uniref:GGDEF domain-containing protein n=2 Tax=Hansschlegelia zhihuaiae TaxID=405005 RepID=A0A4Q0M763_9HYPH|nr:GGDEF domain-containing protein [Hansschlegelia zhihuaiae]
MLAVLAALLIAIGAAHVRQTAAHAIEVAAAAEADLIAADLANGRLTLAGAASRLLDPGFSYGFLARPDGTPIVGSPPAESGLSPSAATLAKTEASPETAISESGGLAHAAKAVLLPNGERAILRFAVTLAPANAAGRDAVGQGLLAALAFFALALPSLALAVDRAAAPLRALTRAVARPGAAEEEVRAAGIRRDEVGALARAHLAIARDLAENADALHRLTFDDPLTRLPNRASLTSRLAVALQLGQTLAIAKIEVEGLSRVAAGLGQQLGDETVKAAARRLSIAAAAWARGRRLEGEQSVMVARISDFGFAFFAHGADADAATSLARAAIAAFEEPLEVGEHRVMAALSIGVALAPEDGDEAAGLLRSASAALSAARAAGPQTIRMAGAELNRMAYGRLRLEQDLRRAIETRELELHYQPQIALKTGAVAGCEALLRWRHPMRGMISPAEFIPIAEECGLVEPLGRFVLGEASRTAAEWAKKGIELRVAVNVSPLQFRKPRFAETTLDIIQAAGASPSQIELEITESAAMGDPEHAARELAPLKEVGVRVAIDDFGTGYSNLAVLTRLPIDVLKIDRGFVNDAARAEGARVVVGTVIGMAESLGLETVAEGVETAEQLDLVTSHGCTHAQGYLFGRPMPASAFEVWYGDRLVSELRSIGSRAARDKRQRAARSVIEPSRRTV